MNQQFYKNMALWVVILVVMLLLFTMLRQEHDAPPPPESPGNPTLEGAVRRQHGRQGRMTVAEPGARRTELDAADRSTSLMKRVQGRHDLPDDQARAPSTLNALTRTRVVGRMGGVGPGTGEGSVDDATYVVARREARIWSPGRAVPRAAAGKSGLEGALDVPRLSPALVTSLRKEREALEAEYARHAPPAPKVPTPAGPVEIPELELASELAADQRPKRGEARWIGSRTEVRTDFSYWRFERLRLRRGRFDCPDDPTWPITEARLPAFAAGKGPLGNGLLAQAAVLHFVEGMPLNQLANVLGARKASVEPAVLGVALRRIGELVEPVYDHVLSLVRDAGKKSRKVDQGTVPVRVTVGRRVLSGHLRGGEAGSHVAFAVALGTPGDALGGEPSGAGARRGLAHAAQCAAEGLSRDGRWGLVRRRLFQALPTTPDRARRGLSLAEVVYVASGNGWGDPGGEAADAVDRFGAWLDAETEGLVTPSLPLDYALQYIVSTWARLLPFDQQGVATLDEVETGRAGQRVPVWRFTREDGGVRTAAVFHTLGASCRRAGHYPQRYLADLFATYAADPETEPKRWTPAAWARRQV